MVLRTNMIKMVKWGAIFVVVTVLVTAILFNPGSELLNVVLKEEMKVVYFLVQRVRILAQHN